MTARFYGNGRVGAGRRDARRRSAPGWRVHWAGSRHTSGHTASILRDKFLCARAILTPSVSLPPFDVYVLLFSLHALSSPPRSSLPPQPPSAPPRPSFCTPHTPSHTLRHPRNTRAATMLRYLKNWTVTEGEEGVSRFEQRRKRDSSTSKVSRNVSSIIYWSWSLI